MEVEAGSVKTGLKSVTKLHSSTFMDGKVVIDGGKVAAEGSHSELMRVCPLYERLYEAHFQRRAA